METADIIAAVALIAGLPTIAFAAYQTYKLRFEREFTINERYTDTETLVGDEKLGPIACEFYGIDLVQAGKEGVTVEHIGHLVRMINILTLEARHKFLLRQCVSRVFDNNDYWQRVFEQPIMQKTWKYACRVYSEPYRKPIDEYLKMHYKYEPVKLSSSRPTQRP